MAKTYRVGWSAVAGMGCTIDDEVKDRPNAHLYMPIPTLAAPGGLRARRAWSPCAIRSPERWTRPAAVRRDPRYVDYQAIDPPGSSSTSSASPPGPRRTLR